MSTTKTILSFIAVAILGLIAYGLISYAQNDFAPFNNGAKEKVGSTVMREGTVQSVDTTQAALDGPVIVRILTDNNKTATISIPSMGLPLCSAFANIDNVWNLSGGERIMISGTISADGSITPCVEESHYLKIENKNGSVGGDEMIACTLDAKICPDGSAVGRVGPNCEFAACPGESGNSTGQRSITVSVGINESISGLGVTLTPKEVLEDSRCPLGVECIWAGTVRLQAALSSGLGTANQVFELGEPITTEAEIVTLVAVRPAPVSTIVINTNEYEFDFFIEKR